MAEKKSPIKEVEKRAWSEKWGAYSPKLLQVQKNKRLHWGTGWEEK